MAEGSKTATGYQYRDDVKTITRIEIIEIRYMFALLISNKLSHPHINEKS